MVHYGYDQSHHGSGGVKDNEEEISCPRGRESLLRLGGHPEKPES